MYFYALLANFFKLVHSFPLYIPPLLLPQSHHRHHHRSCLTPTSPPPQPPILRICHLRLPLLSRKSPSVLCQRFFFVIFHHFAVAFPLCLFIIPLVPHFSLNFPSFIFNLHFYTSFICVLSFCIPYSSTVQEDEDHQADWINYQICRLLNFSLIYNVSTYGGYVIIG